MLQVHGANIKPATGFEEILEVVTAIPSNDGFEAHSPIKKF
jgi:hypothetical protein